VVQALDPAVTQESLARISSRDAKTQATITQYLGENALDALEINQQMIFEAPSARLLDRLAAFQGGLLERLGIGLSGDDLQRMTASKSSRCSTNPRSPHHTGGVGRVHRPVALHHRWDRSR